MKIAAALLALSLLAPALAESAKPAPAARPHPEVPQARGAPKDGAHDFDFELGHWNIHLRKLVHPLSGSKEWVDFDGTSVTRKVWNGRAQLEEFETDSPAGHIEGLTLRTYDPTTRQWRLYWANSKDGLVAVPPQIGRFENGVGVFDAPDTFNGRQILVRFTWSRTDTDKPHFEQSFSADGGKTWEANWITDQTRTAP